MKSLLSVILTSDLPYKKGNTPELTLGKKTVIHNNAKMWIAFKKSGESFIEQ